MSVGNEALMAAIRNRLIGDLRIAALAIDVCCAEGCVSLVGTVDNDEQRKLALELIAGLTGVQNVRDELTIRRFASAHKGATRIYSGPLPGFNRSLDTHL